jgi:hypothetical protein
MNQITNIYRLQAQKLQEQLSSLENELKQLTEDQAPAMVFSGTGQGQKRFSDQELEDQIRQNRRTGMFGAKVEDEKQNQAFKDAQAELARRRGAQNQPTSTAAAPASAAKPSAPASTSSGVRGGGVAPGRKPTEIVGDIPQQPAWLKDASGPLKLPGSFAGDRTGQGQATQTTTQGSGQATQSSAQSAQKTPEAPESSGGLGAKEMVAAAAAGGLAVKSVYDYLGRQRGAKGPTSPQPKAPQPKAPQPEAKPAVPGEAKGPSAPKKGGVTPPQPISTTPEPTGIPDWMKVTDQASAESRFGVGRAEAPMEVNPQLQSGSYKGEVKGGNFGKTYSYSVPRVGGQNVSSQAGVNRAARTPLSGTYDPMAVWKTALPDGYSVRLPNINAQDARWKVPPQQQSPQKAASQAPAEAKPASEPKASAQTSPGSKASTWMNAAKGAGRFGTGLAAAIGGEALVDKALEAIGIENETVRGVVAPALGWAAGEGAVAGGAALLGGAGLAGAAAAAAPAAATAGLMGALSYPMYKAGEATKAAHTREAEQFARTGSPSQVRRFTGPKF